MAFGILFAIVPDLSTAVDTTRAGVSLMKKK
jgi:hypothetical protein